jgi:organic radical activating enzyme
VTDTLRVSETFSNTIQGEGPAAGRSASFVRLMGCNLSCSWCDSAYTWDATRFDLRGGTTLMTAADIHRAVVDGPDLVVMTGGEPLLQQHSPAWAALLEGLVGAGKQVHVETNGTVFPSAVTLRLAHTIVVSPKLANAGDHRGAQDPSMHPGYRSKVVHQAGAQLHLKVVCRDEYDVVRAGIIGGHFGFDRDRVWVMPEGTTVQALQGRWPTIAEAAAQEHVNASHRLHVLAWGDERGR